MFLIAALMVPGLRWLLCQHSVHFQRLLVVSHVFQTGAIHGLAHFVAGRIVDWVSAKDLGATPMSNLADTDVSCWGDSAGATACAQTQHGTGSSSESTCRAGQSMMGRPMTSASSNNLGKDLAWLGLRTLPRQFTFSEAGSCLARIIEVLNECSASPEGSCGGSSRTTLMKCGAS